MTNEELNKARAEEAEGDAVKAALAVLRAERERVAKMEPKPDADGWIPHEGGPCPVGSNERVQVRFRDGSVGADAPREMYWVHGGYEDDIIAWRRA